MQTGLAAKAIKAVSLITPTLKQNPTGVLCTKCKAEMMTIFVALEYLSNSPGSGNYVLITDYFINTDFVKHLELKV
jgi:hypothetical protein